jgi:hypothetical protein
VADHERLRRVADHAYGRLGPGPAAERVAADDRLTGKERRDYRARIRRHEPGRLLPAVQKLQQLAGFGQVPRLSRSQPPFTLPLPKVNDNLGHPV